MAAGNSPCKQSVVKGKKKLSEGPDRDPSSSSPRRRSRDIVSL